MTVKGPDLLQGTLDLLILQTVAMGPSHGYAISQRIMQERGLLVCEWRETEGGRMAKFYSLTRSGRKRLEAERGNWERLSAAIGLILATRPGEA